MPRGYNDDLIVKIARKAQTKFWDVVVSEINAATGDFGIQETIMFNRACEDAVTHFILNNVNEDEDKD